MRVDIGEVDIGEVDTCELIPDVRRGRTHAEPGMFRKHVNTYASSRTTW